MKHALMLSAILATLALSLTAVADTTTKTVGTASGTTTAKAEMAAKGEAATSQMAGHTQMLAKVVWEDAPGYATGVKVAKLHKDANVACAYMKFPAGTKIAAHTHPGVHYGAVISGNGTFAMGADMKGQPMGPGDFFYIPAGTPHWLNATSDLIVFATMTGPEGITYVNPNDDPTKGQAAAH
jgi:quercetin dioxygenase-like cupin family protein